MTDCVVIDDGIPALAPLNDLRPTFDIRTGGLTLLERAVRVLNLRLIAAYVPAELAALTAELHAADGLSINCLPAQPPAAEAPVLLLHARCGLPWPAIASLKLGEWVVTDDPDAPGTPFIVAALVTGAQAGALLASIGSDLRPGPDGSLRIPPPNKHGAIPLATSHAAPAIISRPWHIRVLRDAAIATDLKILQDTLERRAALPGCTVFGTHPLTIDTSAKVYPGSIFDLETGPIHIGPAAVIRPGVTLIGPCIIGAGSTVLDKALIKSQTAIGPGCKVAGEICGTIFAGNANKSHDGHLGDSYISEWANLGAGTTNSNLLNTYGDVPMKALGQPSPERTGQHFMGCIIGDHVKLAIATRIVTGSVVHTGAMWAAGAAITGTVPRFAWVTDDSPPGMKFFRHDKFEAIAKTVMSRRNVTTGPAYLARLAALAAGTSAPPPSNSGLSQ